MNIYALKGHKVMVTEKTKNCGWPRDSEQIKKYLENGKEYTVSHTEVNGWSTRVYIEEFPKIAFNTVNFVDVVEQSKEDDMRHPDWRRYNG